MFETIWHRWLRVPYRLHIRFDKHIDKPRATVVLLHGIGNTGEAWDEVIKKLPEDIRVIVPDLLGFGQSPAPDWTTYNTKTQARAIMKTLIQVGVREPIYLAGHSLGALIAIELTRRYPLAVKSVLLCSPPLYRDLAQRRRFVPRAEEILRDIYNTVEQHPKEFNKAIQVAIKHKVTSKSFSLDDENIGTYMATLKASIINQNALRDAEKIKKPIRIIYGSLDPLVILRNLKTLTKVNKNVTIRSILTGHDIRGRYNMVAAEEITKLVD